MNRLATFCLLLMVSASGIYMFRAESHRLRAVDAAALDAVRGGQSGCQSCDSLGSFCTSTTCVKTGPNRSKDIVGTGQPSYGCILFYPGTTSCCSSPSCGAPWAFCQYTFVYRNRTCYYTGRMSAGPPSVTVTDCISSGDPC